MAQPTRITRCHYMKSNGDLCTAQVVDDLGEILLCSKHLARAWELIQVRAYAQTKRAA
jgi:hypothetical protein